MRTLLILAMGASAALPVVPAEARESLLLPPSSPWNVHYADDSCRLARNFGDGEQKVTLIFDRFVPGDALHVILAGKSLDPRNSFPPLKGTIRFGPDEAEREVEAQIGKFGDQSAILITGPVRLAPPTEQEKAAIAAARRQRLPFDLAPIGEAREAAVEWLEIRKLARHDIVLQTGAMDKALAKLRECSWDTVKMWGLDVEQQKTLTRKPWPKVGPERWFNASDYPAKMARQGYQGMVNFRIIVDANGKPTACHIQTSTRPKDFDEVVCRNVMRRAEFEPALDAQGKPVPSYWRQTVHFRVQ